LQVDSIQRPFEEILLSQEMQTTPLALARF